MLTWFRRRRFAATEPMVNDLLDIIAQQQAMLREQRGVLNEIMAERRKDVDMALRALAGVQVVTAALGTVIHHLSHELKPHPDPKRQTALFLEVASRTADALAAHVGGVGTEPYQAALRELRDAAR